jgi:hypothetical protein
VKIHEKSHCRNKEKCSVRRYESSVCVCVCVRGCCGVVWCGVVCCVVVCCVWCGVCVCVCVRKNIYSQYHVSKETIPVLTDEIFDGKQHYRTPSGSCEACSVQTCVYLIEFSFCALFNTGQIRVVGWILLKGSINDYP